MYFRSLDDLNRDLAIWVDALPRDLDLIAGIPRSGLLAATILSLHMQLPLADVRGLTQGRLLGGGARLGSLDDATYIEKARRILVVDDSVYTGQAIANARALLDASSVADRVEYAAVYASPRSTGKVDHYYEVVPQPRGFEWNILHHPCLGDSCMDIDGVLCRDPSIEENDDGTRYVDFLANVPVRLVPSVAVGYLVTSRLERYRPETEAWLHRAGIRFGELLMHPAATAEERRAAGDHAQFKAGVYKRVDARLFVESDIDQAVSIANLANRPVYCTDSRQMIYPGASRGEVSRPRQSDALRWRLRHELRLNWYKLRRGVRNPRSSWQKLQTKVFDR